MVLLIIIPMKNGYFIGNINPTFSDKPILHVLNLYQRMTGTTILAMRWTKLKQLYTECQTTAHSLEHEHDDLPTKTARIYWYTGLGPSNPPLHVWYIRRANHSLAHPRRLNYTSWLLITSERTTIVTTRGYTTRAACHVALVATWKVPCWTTLVTTVAWYNLIGTH